MKVGRGSIGLRAMNNPLEILQVFDRHLEHDAEVTLFGRKLFTKAQPRVLAIAKKAEQQRKP